MVCEKNLWNRKVDLCVWILGEIGVGDEDLKFISLLVSIEIIKGEEVWEWRIGFNM